MPRYAVGQPVTLSTTVRDGAGALVNAGALVLTVRDAAGGDHAYLSPVNDSTGRYHQDIGAGDLAAVGHYLYEWVATGAGAGVAVGSFDVFAPFGPDVWPTRGQVVKYVPNRLLPADESGDVPLPDFGPLTTPTADQADDHIGAAVAWVTAKCGSVVEGLWASAREVAAVRAAGMVELSYPVRDADVNTAEQLLAQADAWVTALCEANEDLVVPDDGDEGDTAGHVLPRWAFPVPVVYGDDLIWS